MKHDDPIRQALLDAAEEDLREALDRTPDTPAFSADYRAWENAFLRDPVKTAKRARQPFKKPWLRFVACFLLVASLSFGTGLFAGPQVLAALSGWGDPDPAPTPTGLSVSVQLGGTHGTVYTSERFTCVAENGSTLRYWYQNTGTSTCTLQLYRVGLFRDEPAEAPLTISPGEDAVGLYEDPGNDTYYLRVTCVDGSEASVSGSLRADQYD